MAIKRNPDVAPTQDHSYYGLSQAVRQPEVIQGVVDKSGSMRVTPTPPEYPDIKIDYDTSGIATGNALKVAGNALDLGLKGIDSYVKNEIDQSLYKNVDAERDKYSTVLNSTKSAITGVRVDDPAHPLNILSDSDAPQEKPPQYVDDSLKAVARASGAAEAGKLSPTAYYARLNSLAKDLRSQYPGWRDYIDQKISGITGINPANAYIHSITADINALAVKKSDGTEKMLTWMRTPAIAGLPNMQQVYADYVSGKKTEQDVYNYVQPFLAREHSLKLDNLSITNYKGNQEVRSGMVETNLSKQAATEAVNFFDGTRTLAGLDGVTNASKVSDLIRMQQTGQMPPLSDEENHKLGGLILAQKDVIYNKLWRSWNTPIEAEGGKTAVQLLGPGGSAKAKKIIDDQLVLFDQVSSSILDPKKGYASAFFHMDQAKHMLDDTAYRYYGDKDWGEFNRTIAVIGKNSPEALKTIIQYGMVKDIEASAKSWTNKMTLGMAAQKDYRQSGNVNTMLEAIDAAKRLGKTDPRYRDPKIFEDIVKGNAKLIVDPKIDDQTKINFSRAAYDPKDADLLKRFERDTVDPVTGKYKPGRNSVFTALVNPVHSAEMKKLSDKYGDKQVWDNYKSWAEHAFSSDIFTPEINDLHTIQMRPDISLSWDDKNKRFDLKTVPGKITAFTDYRGIENAQKAVNRLNIGISGLRSVYEKDSKDVGTIDAKIINLLVDMGYNPTEGLGTNLPEALVNSIAKPRIRELLKKKMQEQNQTP